MERAGAPEASRPREEVKVDIEGWQLLGSQLRFNGRLARNVRRRTPLCFAAYIPLKSYTA